MQQIIQQSQDGTLHVTMLPSSIRLARATRDDGAECTVALPVIPLTRVSRRVAEMQLLRRSRAVRDGHAAPLGDHAKVLPRVQVDTAQRVKQHVADDARVASATIEDHWATFALVAGCLGRGILYSGLADQLAREDRVRQEVRDE
jgi:hypothetical protein